MKYNIKQGSKIIQVVSMDSISQMLAQWYQIVSDFMDMMSRVICSLSLWVCLWNETLLARQQSLDYIMTNIGIGMIFLSIYIFIRPFEKRTYYAVAMSVRLSVRPSVRPSAFSGLFFNMLWDINLKLGIYIQWVARHVEFELHHNWVTLT